MESFEEQVADVELSDLAVMVTLADLIGELVAEGYSPQLVARVMRKMLLDGP